MNQGQWLNQKNREGTFSFLLLFYGHFIVFRFKHILGDMHGPELGCFLMLVLFHPQQDVGQGCDGFYDVRPFVKHDAFGPFAHGGVGNFSSRRKAFLTRFSRT